MRKTVNGKRKTVFLKENTRGSYRSITARLSDNTYVARMDLILKPRKKSLSIGSVNVDPDFRRKGISKDLFNHAMDIGRKNNRNKIIGSEIVHAAQITIRSKFDTILKFTKSGKIRTRKINSENAKSIIYGNRNSNYTGTIAAETKIPRKNFKRVRVRGRWLTIKRQK